MRRVLPLLALLSLAFAPAPPYRPKPGDIVSVENLVGRWRCEEMYRTPGRERLDPVAQNAAIITIGPTRWVFADGRVGYDLRIQTARTPAEFDLAYSGQVEPLFRGLLERRGETVRVIYSSRKRPTSFEDPSPSCYTLKLRRQ